MKTRIMKSWATFLFVILLCLLPAAALMEQAATQTWNNRLAWPDFSLKPSRHTPRFFAGTFLPPVIKSEMTLTAADNPIIIKTVIKVARPATLIMAPGVKVYFSENTGINVAGRLLTKGTQDYPVKFMTNEVHPLNQTWTGIIALAGSWVELKQATIKDASPAITCLPGSQVLVNNTTITSSAVGAYIASNNCVIKNSFIHSQQNGVVAVGVKLNLVDSVVKGNKHDIKTVKMP